MPAISSELETDRYGRDWKKLLLLQKTELAQWKRVLKPEAYETLAEWCEMVNRQTTVENQPKGAKIRTGGLHSCPVGCELHHFIMDFKRPKVSKEDLDLL